jgi:hypothetical protein
MCGEWSYCSRHSKGLTLVRNEWSATRIDQLTLGKRVPPYPVVRGRVHPAVGRQVVQKGKTAPPAGNRDSGSLLFQPLAKMSYHHHHGKTSQLDSLNASAADYLRSTKGMSSPQRQDS